MAAFISMLNNFLFFRFKECLDFYNVKKRNMKLSKLQVY